MNTDQHTSQPQYSMQHSDKNMDTIIAFAKRKGFVFPGSEIYDGLAGVYDFGPYGTALINNLKNYFRQKTVRERNDMYEIDSAMFKNPAVWDASGHTAGFSDPIVEHRETQVRLRVDKELEALDITADEKMSTDELQTLFDTHSDAIAERNKLSNNFTPVRAFNLLVQSNLGNFSQDPTSDPVYLPGEACQGIYLNYKNILDTIHPAIPFGMMQIGKAFRNEISPRQFLFRTREFEQADTQYFIRPGQNTDHFVRIKSERMAWHQSLGINPDNLAFKQHDNLVFYAADAWDIEYNFPTYGFDEVEGIHDRTDYDLTQHQKHSGADLSYNDNGDKFIPYIIETSMGMGRLFLAVLSEAYDEQDLTTSDENGIEKPDSRVVLRLKPFLAPITVAVLPLMKKDGLAERAQELTAELSKHFATTYDQSGSVGKRYRRQDEIGTPLCVTLDYDTLSDDTVTVRDRDTMEQIRLPIADLQKYVFDYIQFP